MGRINVGRLVLGGIVASVVIFLIEAAMGPTYMADMIRAMQAHNLSMPSAAAGAVGGALLSLLMGFGLVFFYAAARPRFGAGVKTAVIVAVGYFVFAYLAGLIGYGLMGLYPTDLLVRWGVQGFVELTLASIAGAWLYRE